MSEPITHTADASAPTGTYRLVTPSDSADLPDGPCRGFLIGTGGLMTITDNSGKKCVGVPFATGWNPGGATRVWSTDTAATNVWAVY